jgi:hypothetical protein
MVKPAPDLRIINLIIHKKKQALFHGMAFLLPPFGKRTKICAFHQIPDHPVWLTPATPPLEGNS